MYVLCVTGFQAVAKVWVDAETLIRAASAQETGLSDVDPDILEAFNDHPRFSRRALNAHGLMPEPRKLYADTRRVA